MQNNDKINKAIELIKDFSENEWDLFLRSIWKYNKCNGLPIYENSSTSKEDAYELHNLLVQTCIDFINKKDNKEISEVHFNADGLDFSAKYKEWTPQTDSYMLLVGNQKEENSDYLVRKKIIESY
jgi:hypothetical protein